MTEPANGRMFAENREKDGDGGQADVRQRSCRPASVSRSVLLGAVFVAGWMYHFTSSLLHSKFAADEMMNIYQYWSHGPWSLMRALVLFPSRYYRPMGGVYYSTLFHFSGLNPLPFHIAISTLMVVNTLLVWRIVRLLCGSALIAGLQR